MRSADEASLLRIPLLILLLYAITIRYNPLVLVFLFVVLFVSDAADGYLASDIRHTPKDFALYLLEGVHIANRKNRPRKNTPKYADNLDIAIDRIIEYAFWLTFTLLQLLPWIVIAIIFVRNTIADLLMLRRGKGHPQMQSAVGKIVSSSISRGSYAALKAINFAYLSLSYVSGWPANIGYLLTVIVVIYSLIRGVAEIYESLR